MLHSAPSDSLKLSSRLHEKQVFVQSLLINFINNSCWKRHKKSGNSPTNSLKKSAKLSSKFSIKFQCFWRSFWYHFGTVLGPFLGSFGCQNQLWMHLGSILGAPWSILKAFWEIFGRILDTLMLNQSFDAISDRIWMLKRIQNSVCLHLCSCKFIF